MQNKTTRHKGKQEERQAGRQAGRQAETKASGRWTHHPTQGNKSGDNGRQGETRPREDGHTIQHRHRQDPREGGHTIQQRETRRGTMGDKGRRDPREGGHTIQHQGGHLKIALKTANSTLFGDKTLNRSLNIVKILHLHKITLEVDTSGWLWSLFRPAVAAFKPSLTVFTVLVWLVNVATQTCAISSQMILWLKHFNSRYIDA